MSLADGTVGSSYTVKNICLDEAAKRHIAAMCELDEQNGKSVRPSHEMCRFAVMNTASLQLFPTTILGILSACGSENPFSIVPIIWISSVISLFAALAAEWLLSKKL